MKQKQLGRNTLMIPAVGQGCMGIGGYFSPDFSNDAALIDTIKLGLDLGMTLLDTAEIYGGGHSEELVGIAVRGIRARVFLATKVSPEHLSRGALIRSCEQSLTRLGTDHVDLYQVHWPNPCVPIAETMEALSRLHAQGKIRCIGLSNFSLKQLQEAEAVSGGMPIDAVQVEYNLFDRTIEHGLLPYCQAAGITVIAYSPLNQGGIARSGARGLVLERIAHAHGLTAAQVALAWLISRHKVVAIPKASRPDHIRQNAAAGNLELAPEDSLLIDEAFRMLPRLVPPEDIRVIVDDRGQRSVYQTIDEALENPLGFCPSPAELAAEIMRLDEAIKPVRVRRSRDAAGREKYELVEGRIRYWAWVIAHGRQKPIPVLVHEEQG